jgi:4-aminobutyrate--pyruvate transaminase
MFGMETYGFQPDIASFAKGVTSGYIPLGGVVLSDEIFDVMAEPDRMFMHGFTYAGHPVACAVGLRNIQIIEDENLAGNAKAMGEYLLSELQRTVGDHRHIGQVRGKGLMLMVEFAADKGTREKFDVALNVGGRMQAANRKRGLIVRASNDGIAIAPPLIISKDQCDALVAGIAESVDEVFA